MGLIEKPGKVKPESKIIYQGKELTGYTEKEWNTFRGKECSMVFQDALVSLNPTMKVGKQIAENLKNHESSLSKEGIPLFFRIPGKLFSLVNDLTFRLYLSRFLDQSHQGFGSYGFSTSLFTYQCSCLSFFYIK